MARNDVQAVASSDFDRDGPVFEEGATSKNVNQKSADQREQRTEKGLRRGERF